MVRQQRKLVSLVLLVGLLTLGAAGQDGLELVTKDHRWLPQRRPDERQDTATG